MSAFLQGTGLITPLGIDAGVVWQRLLCGEKATPAAAPAKHATRQFFQMTVPSGSLDPLSKNPRLRRASPISYFTVGAGLAALKDAAVEMTAEFAARTALVFAVSSGSVVYTRRFYEGIIAGGAQSASPLLFPETVYNAPASHLAALLGITGATYTLVGDASVGISALKLAETLLDSDQAGHVLVVGGEEADWVISEGYGMWRHIARQPRIELWRNGGTIIADGGAAVLLGREGRLRLGTISAGAPFMRQRDAGHAARKVCNELAEAGGVDLVVASANGTFVDRAEAAALTEFFPDASVYCPKAALGEALGASALLQVVCAALAISTRRVPAVIGAQAAPADLRVVTHAIEGRRLQSALVSVVGLNHQASGLRLEKC